MPLTTGLPYIPGHPGRKEDVGLQVDEGSIIRLWEGLTILFEVPKSEGADIVFDEETPRIGCV